MRRKQKQCAGCHQSLSSKASVVSCHFKTKGFDIFFPCGTSYHITCIKAGAPFHTRRQGDLGLSFPDNKYWGNFVCKACTVRSVTRQEILSKNDATLLKLERMRLIDMSWHWSKGTHDTYKSKIGTIRKFEQDYDLTVLPILSLSSPPASPDIPLMWCMEAQSTRKTTIKSRGAGIPDHISSVTVRQLRSAAAQHYQWAALISHPSASILTKEKRLLYQPCRPTDSAAFTMFATGLNTRMGDQASPSYALLERHVIAVDRHLNQIYKTTTCPLQRREAALGGLGNVLLWLGWLRSGECFGLAWDDIEAYHHRRHAEYELPEGLGFVSLLLAPETKSSRSKRADIILAHQTNSGFQPLRWHRRARNLCPDSDGTSLIFKHANGAPWTSMFFRKQYLFPVLRRLKSSGDAYLSRRDIEKAFWSLHSYRRGARTHVSHKIKGQRSIASKEQIYEHARWRYNSRNLPIDVIYRQWSYKDRIKLTRLFM